MTLAEVFEIPIQAGRERDSVVAPQHNLVSPGLDFKNIAPVVGGDHFEDEGLLLGRQHTAKQSARGLDAFLVWTGKGERSAREHENDNGTGERKEVWIHRANSCLRLFGQVRPGCSSCF